MWYTIKTNKLQQDQIVRIDQCQSIQLMEEHEYAQMIVRLNYIDSVCDGLLGKGKTDYNDNVRISGRRSQQPRAQNKELSLRIRQVDRQLQYAKQKQKFLKNQIFALNQSLPITTNPTHNKTIRQLSSIQLQLSYTRRLLNSELLNLNSINVSKGQISEGIDKLQQRQRRLKNKLEQLSRQEREYVECERLESEYGRLLEDKNNLIHQSQQKNYTQQSLIHNQLLSIQQSAQTLEQMRSYQNQLTRLILQQKFIIKEISSRQQPHKTRYQIDGEGAADEDIYNDDSNIFQEEVQILRKTIANRSFITHKHNTKRHNHVGQLDKFVNHPTPKNTTIQNRRVLRKSFTDGMQSAQESIQLSYLKKLSIPKQNQNDKIFDIHHKSLSIDNVFKRIQEIKKTQQESQKDKVKQTQSSKTKSEKIKVIKLLTGRKRGNLTAYRRKGMALGVEDYESELQQQAKQKCQILLPRIAEQQDSIRNTLQSILPH